MKIMISTLEISMITGLDHDYILLDVLSLLEKIDVKDGVKHFFDDNEEYLYTLIDKSVASLLVSKYTMKQGWDVIGRFLELEKLSNNE